MAEKPKTISSLFSSSRYTNDTYSYGGKNYVRENEDGLLRSGAHYQADGSVSTDVDFENERGPDPTINTKKTKTIDGFEIETRNIPNKGESRGYIVIGDEGAKYYIKIRKGTDDKYYNFNTGAFQAEHISHVKTIGSSGVDNGTVVFPAVTSDESYVVSIHKSGTETISNIDNYS